MSHSADYIQPDDDYESTEGSFAARSKHSQTGPHSQQAESSRHPSFSPLSTVHIPGLAIDSPTQDQPALTTEQLSSNDTGPVSKDATRSFDAREVIYLGQASEIQWLRHLKTRLERYDSTALSGTPFVNDIDFYSNDHDIQIISQNNPFHLPTEHTATMLFQCYFKTLHVSLPMISDEIQDELGNYYNSMRAGHPVALPQIWHAIVNLVFAIGLRFSRLTAAEWLTDVFDETVYLSRAYQLLSLNNPVIVIENTDVSLVQALGLLAIYYLVIGHNDRAWNMTGTAMRAAIGHGLHTRSQTFTLEPKRRQLATQTWWALYNLDNLISSVTGRPNMLRIEDITTTLPSGISAQPSPKDPVQPSSFLDMQVRMGTITQRVLATLYTEQREARSWSRVHTIIPKLMSELDAWAQEAVPDRAELVSAMTKDYAQQITMKKQYCRLKILITRPALRRIELCLHHGTEDFTAFDLETAEACIMTAHDVAALFPQEINLRIMYERGPWWTITHNIMQALAVLLIAISCRKHLEASYATSITAVGKLVMWLRYMRHGNNTAKRAYNSLYSIVKSPHLLDPFVWGDVEGFFPDEDVASRASAHGQADDVHAYGAWPRPLAFPGADFEFQ
ncbi:fungal-specific transcription factor domain-containing protein [Phaeosphaeria sp. MPI-PUGE-AT-0046c]|nr:fungal-specific transcription factor domain-containing protein [Phaeosphaeria sp. MPI-PUGE-AT-0046c]